MAVNYYYNIFVERGTEIAKYFDNKYFKALPNGVYAKVKLILYATCPRVVLYQDRCGKKSL